MKKLNRCISFLAVVMAVLLIVSPVPSQSAEGDTTVVSINPDGDTANNDSENPSVSSDGRYVAFESDADDLLGQDTSGDNIDTNYARDIFVYDRTTDKTTRVSVNSDGEQGTTPTSAYNPAISADGRFVAFESDFTNLVDTDGDGVFDDDTNNDRDIFVHDRDADGNGVFDEAGKISTTRVSIASDGTQGVSRILASAYNPAISAGGRFVAFESDFYNLIGEDQDNNSASDVFVHDRDTDKDGVFDEPGAISTTRVSVASDGTEGTGDDGSAYNPAISAGGRFVAFESDFINLVDPDGDGVFDDDTNGARDIFVRDRDADENGVFDEEGTGKTSTTRVSVNSNGEQGTVSSMEPLQVSVEGAYSPAISAKGRYVAFYSGFDNLVAGDENNANDVFVHDRQTDTTTLVSKHSNGTQGNDDSGGEEGSIDEERLVRIGSGGGGNGVAISQGGRFVTFQSIATNLVDGDTNGVSDIFVHDRDADGNGVFDEAGTGKTSTTRVSVASDGSEGEYPAPSAYSPAISANGRFVAFHASFYNLVVGDENGANDVFVHEFKGPLVAPQTVGAAGGTISVTGTGGAFDGVKIVIPEGALDSDVEIGVAEVLDPPDLRSDMEGVALLVELTPSGITFNPPGVEVTIPYSGDTPPAAVYYYDLVDEEWKVIAEEGDEGWSIDENAKTVTFRTLHFTDFGAGGTGTATDDGGGTTPSLGDVAGDPICFITTAAQRSVGSAPVFPVAAGLFVVLIFFGYVFFKRKE